MARIEIAVTVKNIYSYEAPAYGYGYETRYIYNMVAEDGTVYVWKTAACMSLEIEDQNSNFANARGKKVAYSRINKDDKIVITASVKGQSEYKGQPQTEVNRVKVVERTFKAKTWEEIQEERRVEREHKAQEQRDSLSGEDFIWRMPYKQYKEHYSDCETVAGSFERREFRPCTIEVIVREGRLKASGVREEHYSGYKLENKEGEQVVYRAVKEENAIRRAEKEFGGTWECIKIYDYSREW